MLLVLRFLKTICDTQKFPFNVVSKSWEAKCDGQTDEQTDKQSRVDSMKPGGNTQVGVWALKLSVGGRNKQCWE